MASEYEPDYQGYTTVLNVINAASEARIIHVTVWNAVGAPAFSFDEVLSGYDHWQIFFRDMIAGNFNLFDTSQAAESNANTGYRQPNEWGPDGRSAWPMLSPTLAGLLPPQSTTADYLSPTGCTMPYGIMDVRANVDAIRSPLLARAHFGCDVNAGGRRPSGITPVRAKFVDHDWLSQIAGTGSASTRIWFYVTVDTVTRCDAGFPSDVGYFSSSFAPDNVLMGDVVYLSATGNFSESFPAVRIESDPTRSGLYNFYEEKAAPSDVANVSSEPLSTALAFEWYDTPLVSSSLILWKNFSELWPAGSEGSDKVDDCGPYLYYAWDENEHAISRAQLCLIPDCTWPLDANVLPFQTQMVPINRVNFDLPAPDEHGYGWMLLIFPPSYGFASPGGDTGDASYDPSSSGGDNLSTRPYMAWAAVKLDYGSYSTIIEATEAGNAHCFPGDVQPGLGVGVKR